MLEQLFRTLISKNNMQMIKAIKQQESYNIHEMLRHAYNNMQRHE